MDLRLNGPEPKCPYCLNDMVSSPGRLEQCKATYLPTTKWSCSNPICRGLTIWEPFKSDGSPCPWKSEFE